MKIHLRAKFITIERPLVPPPPISSTPYWCYINTLTFHNKKGDKVWEQEIPEAKIFWFKGRRGDQLDHYFSCQVFKDGHFGWQLQLKISHEAADFWLEKMIEYIEAYDKNHFAENPIQKIVLSI